MKCWQKPTSHRLPSNSLFFNQKRHYGTFDKNYKSFAGEIDHFWLDKDAHNTSEEVSPFQTFI